MRIFISFHNRHNSGDTHFPPTSNRIPDFPDQITSNFPGLFRSVRTLHTLCHHHSIEAIVCSVYIDKQDDMVTEVLSANYHMLLSYYCTIFIAFLAATH